MNTKPVAPVQAQAQHLVPKHAPIPCTEEDVERAVIEAFAAVFRRQTLSAAFPVKNDG